jgi:hypothetical protein
VVTEVVLAALAVLASPTGDTRFQGHPVARLDSGDGLAHSGHLARALVTENQRILDDEVADATVFVVVDVRPTDAHLPHPDQHFVGGRFWLFALNDFKFAGFGE